MTDLLLHFSVLMMMASVASALSSMPKKVAVIGATGRLGRQTVQKLLSKEIPVKILVRHDISAVKVPENLENANTSAEVAAYLASLPSVELVKGDVTNKDSVAELVKDTTAVLAVYGANRKSKLTDALPWSKCEDDPSHSKQVNYEGVRNIVTACQMPGCTCKRIVRITGKGEDPWNPFSILINLLGSMAKAWNNEGEALLRDCKDVDYTIIRPGVMGRPDCPDGKVLALADNGGDLKVSAIPYSTVADLCIECLDYPNTARATLCAMNVPPGEGEETYGPLLAKVQPDSRIFPKVFDEHRRAVRAGAVGISAILCAGIFAIVSALRACLSFILPAH
eukprot:CAMPEP_0116008936 /NCGR_PEP_ID=MMETSP0321-20121206/3147_1 /TAXON_ID=163516 /ORGANISM="Leptocylindrus danicus var. danicus, Strain B650" /LENGTH=336 /DNA_ID=CAMNT_0003477829 /DNA_START=96 /DNA_END=1103 /DNA_ORIENTATION=+